MGNLQRYPTIQAEFFNAIWHCEDHCASKVVAYCPCLYYDLINKTFFDTPEVFRLEKTTPHEAGVAIRKLFPLGVKRRCKWAFRLIKRNTMLPEGFIIPMGKHKYRKARPVIAFGQFWLKELHRVGGIILARIANHQKTHKFFSVLTTQQAANQLKRFRKQLSTVAQPEDEIVIDNDDLAGFFTSVPQDRLLRDAELMIERFLADSPSSVEDGLVLCVTPPSNKD